MDVTKYRKKLPESVYNELSTIMSNRTITDEQLSAFLANCKHESANFTAVVENLNYSSHGLAKTFPKIFAVDPKALMKIPNPLAISLNRRPEKIANLVYANRGGNGNSDSGDGWKFRGRGYIQCTFRSNYAGFDATVLDNIIDNPQLLETKYPLQSAMWFFDVNKLWTLATKSKFTTLVRKINGGVNGLDERKKFFDEFIELA